jgi:NAD(P)-dependent dehydrogenase (short-subunit alcohol dehydrogenase family)
MTILDRFRLDGRVAIVTGASSGLGVAFARALAEVGAGR